MNALFSSFSTLGVLALTMTASLHAAPAPDSFVQDARMQMGQLGTSLQQTLQQTMRSEGPLAAIDVCHQVAPELAEQLSEKGWQVGRTALKVRNPDNRADEWEQQVLLQFAEALAGNPDTSQLEASLETDHEYRYMRAIPTGMACLACHGDSIAEPIQTRLQALYPDDEAVGFQLGDLRGAFTIRQQKGL
ncbi:MAG: DUF3365 domain-containing protein [Bacterioplanes sp.]|nr:DUF3365 domain-containing protein [Bacterioplanes sp.]